MLLVRAKQGSAHVGDKCRACTCVIKPGQVILTWSLRDGPVTRPNFTLHVPCVRKLTESAPPDQDEEAFFELQRRIHETGDLFPDG